MSTTTRPRGSATTRPGYTPHWTPAEVAAYLGCSPRQVLRWASRRELPSVRLGAHVIRFRAADVEAFAAARRVTARREA